MSTINGSVTLQVQVYTRILAMQADVGWNERMGQWTCSALPSILCVDDCLMVAVDKCYHEWREKGEHLKHKLTEQECKETDARIAQYHRDEVKRLEGKKCE